ncbi:MAG: ribosomal protein S18-alanine N-acetyltransferase [Myxococcota bacterium]|nr:ribosomal protein S18-alanine N-acetyltransferase [Myxococcota bacterium]
MLKLIRIEPMTPADVLEVAGIEGPTRMDPAQLRDELARTWSRLWVARESLAPEPEEVAPRPRNTGARTDEGSRIVAFLVAWHVADELHVLNVATHQDRRRCGIGRAMMNAVIAYARNRRVQQVLLEVRRSNAAALALYRRLGFFAMRIRSRYYPDDEDAVEMVLLLDPNTGEIVLQRDELQLEN